MAIQNETQPYALGRDDFYVKTHQDLDDMHHPSDQLDMEVDATWVREHVPQVRDICELVIDAGQVSRAAELLAQVMTEFVIDGEAFQPSQDVELRGWLQQMLREQVDGIGDETIDILITQIDDFPPADKKLAAAMDDAVEAEAARTYL